MAKKKDGVKDKQDVSFIRTSSVEMKIHHPDFLKDLEYTQARLAHYVGLFADFLIVARGESYVDGDRVVHQKEVLDRQRKYVPNGNPKNNQAKLREFYDRVIKGQHNIVISYVSALYNKDSDIGKSTRLNKKTGEQNEVEEGRALCRKFLDSNLFPVVKDELPNVGFYRSAWIVAFSAIKSWHQMNEAYVQKTQMMQAKLEKAKSKLTKVPIDILSIGDQWLAAMKENERRIDRRYIQTWKGVRRSLLNGSERETDAVQYHPFHRLWEEVDYITPIAKCFVMESALEARLPNPRFPRLGDESSPLLTSITGSNCIPISLECEDGSFVGKTKLICHDSPDTTRTWAFKTTRSKYFQDLDVRTVKTGATSVCEIEFFKGCKKNLKIRGDVKEPRIQKRQGRFFLDVIYTLRNDEKDGIKSRFWENWNKASFFVDKNTKKTIHDMKTFVKGQGSSGLRVMSVDLGINPIFIYSVYSLDSKKKDDDSFEVDGVGWANLIDCGRGGMVKSRSFRDKMVNLVDRMRMLKKIIRHRKSILNDRLSSHHAYVASIQKAFEFFGESYSTDTTSLKRWCLDEIASIRDQYQELRAKPYRLVGVMSEQIVWASLVREFIRLMQTWKYGGKKSKNELQPDQKRSWVQDTDFQAYRQYLANYKKDVMKRIASAIRDKCLEHDVDILLLEDLENFTFSVERDKGTNNMLEVWSPNTIIRWIKNACQAHGIFVMTINPRDSSRLDPQTGEYGYRSKVAKEVLLVRRYGKVVMIDSDEAATKNLQKRFWMKFHDLHRVECVVDSATGEAAPIGLNGRAARYFESKVGSASVIIRGGEVQRATAASIKRMTKDVDDEDGEDEDKKIAYYRHGERWVPRNEHWEIVEGIFEEIQASPLVEARNYVSRVKALQGKKKRNKHPLSGG